MDPPQILNFNRKPKAACKRNPHPLPNNKAQKESLENRGKSEAKKKSNKSLQREESKGKKIAKLSEIVSHSKKNETFQNREQKFVTSGETTPDNNSYSSTSQLETKTLLNHVYSPQNKNILNLKSWDISNFISKKDRKYSQDISAAVQEYQQLRQWHSLQEKLMKMTLNQREMHRLQKILAVEQVQQMIRIIRSRQV